MYNHTQFIYLKGIPYFGYMLSVLSEIVHTQYNRLKTRIDRMVIGSREKKSNALAVVMYVFLGNIFVPIFCLKTTY